MALCVANLSDCSEVEQRLALHELALGTMSHGVCVYDARQRLVLFNQRFVEHHDLSTEALHRGMTMRDVFLHAAERLKLTRENLDAAWNRRQKNLAKRLPFSSRHPLPDGRTIASTLRPMPDGGWVAVYEDVTPQLLLERELRLQFDRMQQAIGHMSHGLCMFDADERLIMCNELYLSLYDLDPEVVRPGISHREILDHFVSRGNQTAMTSDAFYDARMEIVRTGEGRPTRLLLGNGRVMEARSRRTPDGGWVTACQDITERLRHEADLHEQNARFDAAINNMSQGIVMFDARHRLIVCNQKYLTIFRSDPAVVKPGAGMREIFQHGVDIGLYPGTPA